FGCGGDRDAAKRPIMGAIAAKLADLVVVTSDNPRTEEPMSIINAILEGMKGTKTPVKVIENRREAIRAALKLAQPNDIVLLAGKGHEDYQIIGKEKNHFDEREVVRDILEGENK
ncbi:MAG: UDP-N-acetylmuramoyl-L-alanyl-D-glutamate--2,6-diaminopimelate ligase, partial [Oscillospiraceae bacterium]|nr:UDP-N-acetylmuramoyl-L-alanyl-D-glutamate--2,6-diaminopimelate ligase [Oscillospiraceae bacterium]